MSDCVMAIEQVVDHEALNGDQDLGMSNIESGFYQRGLRAVQLLEGSQWHQPAPESIYFLSCGRVAPFGTCCTGSAFYPNWVLSKF